MALPKKAKLIIILLISLLLLLLKIYIFPQRSDIPVPPQITDATGRASGNYYEDELIILYNRIPKTGSTSFMSVLYALQEKNNINLAFVNVSSQSHRFTFLDQYKFALNITQWKRRKPAIYHGHFPFLNFNLFSLRQPIYINIIRKPLERVVSHYYFIRYGDTYLPNKIRKYQGDTRTFDDCVVEHGAACDIKKLWFQIPYFCGSDPDCWEPGNKKALARAKANVINHYFLVGVTEEISKFVELLEKSIPRFFRSATQMFTKDGGVQIRKTKVKRPLRHDTIEYFKKSKLWQMENEFYNFVKRRFHYIYKTYQSSSVMQVSYVKVKPD